MAIEPSFDSRVSEGLSASLVMASPLFNMALQTANGITNLSTVADMPTIFSLSKVAMINFSFHGVSRPRSSSFRTRLILPVPPQNTQ
jgi:hypothetical protein